MNTPSNTQNTPSNTPQITPIDTPDNAPANELEAVLERIGDLLANDTPVHVAIWRANASGGWDTVKTKLPAAEFDPDTFEPGRWRVRVKVGERMTLDKQATFTRSAVVIASAPAPAPDIAAAAPVALQPAPSSQYTRGTAGGFDPFQFVIEEMRAAREQSNRLMERLTQPAPASNQTETIQLIGALKPLLSSGDKSATDAKTILEIGEKLAERFAGGDAPAPAPREESGLASLARMFAPAFTEFARAVAPVVAASMAGGGGGGGSSTQSAPKKRAIANTAPAAPAPTPAPDQSAAPSPDAAGEQANAADAGVISQTPSEAITPDFVLAQWLEALRIRKPKTIARAGSLLVAIYDGFDSPPTLDAIEVHIMANLETLASECHAKGIDVAFATEALREVAAIMDASDDDTDDSTGDTDDAPASGEGVTT